MSKKRPRPQIAADTKGLVCGDAELACDTNQPAPRPMKRARSGTSPRGTLNPQRGATYAAALHPFCCNLPTDWWITPDQRPYRPSRCA